MNSGLCMTTEKVTFDFAGESFRHGFDEFDFPRIFVGGSQSFYMLLQFFYQSISGFKTFVQNDVCFDFCSSEGVGGGNYCDFMDSGVLHHDFFDFKGADAVS